MTTADQILDPPRTAHLPGAQLEYWERGEGPTVLLVHAGAHGDWFAPVYAEPALDGVRVVRYRRAGYGGSTSAGGPPDIADHARHGVALLAHLGVTSACWVGHSSGGAVALQAAIDAPQAVSGLVLLEPAPKPEGPSAAQLGPQVIGPAMGAFATGDVATAADIFLTGVCGPGHRELIERRLGPDGVHAIEHDARTFFAEELPAAAGWTLDPADLAGVRPGAVLVAGLRGRSVTRAHYETAELLAAALPGAQLVELPHVGHAMPLEDPATVAALVSQVRRRHG